MWRDEKREIVGERRRERDGMKNSMTGIIKVARVQFYGMVIITGENYFWSSPIPGNGGCSFGGNSEE